MGSFQDKKTIERRKTVKAKTTTIIVIMLVLMTTIVTAEETATKTNLQEIEYKQVVIQENAKTQAYIKQELAKRDAEIEKKVYKYIDDNFAVLDGRIDGFIRKASFKLGMVFLSGMVLGGTILMLINKKLRRKTLAGRHLQREEGIKGETDMTTLDDETVEQLKRLERGEQPKTITKERIRDIKKEFLDNISVDRASVNDYLRIGDSK